MLKWGKYYFTSDKHPSYYVWCLPEHISGVTSLFILLYIHLWAASTGSVKLHSGSIGRNPGIQIHLSTLILMHQQFVSSAFWQASTGFPIALILRSESEASSSYQKADLSGSRAWARPGVVMNITHTPTQERVREGKGEGEHGCRGFDLKWQMLMERPNASANFHFGFLWIFFFSIFHLFTEKVPDWKERVFGCVRGRGQGLYWYDHLFQCFTKHAV